MFVVSNRSFYPEVSILSFRKMGRLLKALPLIFKVSLKPERLDLIIHLYELLYGREYLTALRSELVESGCEEAVSRSAHLEIPPEHSDLFLAFSKTHDVWHVVTGFGTGEADEIGLQAFYLSQHPTPLAALLISLSLVRSFFRGLASFVEVFDRACLGWHMGKMLRHKLINFKWGDRWFHSVDALREEINLVPADLSSL